MYRIRWTNDANNAKPGEGPMNESYYPEDWISTEENIGLRQKCAIEIVIEVASDEDSRMPPVAERVVLTHVVVLIVYVLR